MAKKRRRADHPRRPVITRRVRPEVPGDDPVLTEIRRATYEAKPMLMLQAIAAVLEAADDPLDLVTKLAAVDSASTTMALHAIATLAGDAAVAQACADALSNRHQPVPTWLARLPETWIGAAGMITDRYRHGSSIMVDVRLPDGDRSTVVLMLLHVGEPTVHAFTLGDLPALQALAEPLTDPLLEGSTSAPLEPATVRAMLESSIDTVPREGATGWPQARPLLRWILTLMPDGGTSPFETNESLASAMAGFFASPHGETYAAEHTQLVRYLLDYNERGGDPLWWTPGRVEDLFGSWITTRPIPKAHQAGDVPAVLAALIAYGAAATGQDPVLTQETRAMLNRLAPSYNRVAPRVGVASAISMLAWGRYGDPVEAVGSRQALAALTTDPLPDEPFDATGLPDDLETKLLDIVALTDDCATELFDIEHRTAARRLLRTLVLTDADLFRNRQAAEGTAAAISWLTAQANGTLAPVGDLPVSHLMNHYGVRSASEKGQMFRKALGLPPHDAGFTRKPMTLGSPDFLTAQRRADLIDLRDRTSR